MFLKSSWNELGISHWEIQLPPNNRYECTHPGSRISKNKQIKKSHLKKMGKLALPTYCV